MIPRILIVDDEGPARARLKMVLSDIVAECPHVLVGEAGHVQEALRVMPQLQPDIVLLDVQMPGMTGIELAATLSTTAESAPSVIFVSAYDDYALKAFDVHALDYLLKPVRAARLAEAIRRVAGMRVNQQHTRQETAEPIAEASATMRKHFTVHERGRLLLVPIADVIYLKAELKYVTLRTKERDFLIEESLQSIEDELGAIFVRVHRNALVARDAIIGVERGALPLEGEAEAGKLESWQVILQHVEEKLPISRRQWPVVKALVR